jgi:FkbM family methyltransferase
MDNFFTCLTLDEFKINFIKNDNTITHYAKTNNKIWEYWLEKYINEVYKENTNMIDIGAHIGTFSLMMSRYISSGSHIYAFEPVYGKILEMNIKENNLENKIKTFGIGLSNKSEKLTGFVMDFSQEDNYGFTQIINLEKANEESQLIIYVETLDSFNIENVSFIKIDVEGNERNVLEGSINTILKNLPTILIEIWCTATSSIKKYTKEENLPEIKKQFDVFEILFNLGYICIPVSPITDDFLFIHYTKKELLNKIINKLS